MLPCLVKKNTRLSAIIALSLSVSGLAVTAQDLSASSEIEAAGPAGSAPFDLGSLDESVADFFEMGPFMFGEEFETGVRPPPANSSVATQNELMALRSSTVFQNDPAMLDAIFFEANSDMTDVFEAYGLIPSRRQAPDLRNLLDDLNIEVYWLTLREKITHQRPRPSQIDATIPVAIDGITDPSYPSEHAAQSHAIALMLSSLNSGARVDYMELADEVSVRREIAGLNFRSDTSAGKILASRVVNDFMVQPDVMSQLGAVRLELRRHRLPPQ